jgi:hypothetical protein
LECWINGVLYLKKHPPKSPSKGGLGVMFEITTPPIQYSITPPF